jgi:hypothetical protein
MEITVIAELSKTTIHVEKKIKQIFKGMPENKLENLRYMERQKIY